MDFEIVKYELNKLLNYYKGTLELNRLDEIDYIGMGRGEDTYVHMLRGQNFILENAILSTSAVLNKLTYLDEKEKENVQD